MLFPADAEGQAAVLAELARRAYPSFDLFLYALLSGAILAAGFLLDSQAVLIFGVLAAPLLTPWVGLSIAAVTGSPRFFLQTFAALIVSAVIVFLIGLAAGFASLPFEPRTHAEVHLHARLWPSELVVLALGAVLLTLAFVRAPDKPYLPSVVLAYALYLPLGAAGFGLGARLEGVWPQAAWVALVHFAWATFLGMLTLAFLRFRPRSFGGFLFALILTAALLTALWTWTGLGRFALDFARGTPPSLPFASVPSPAPTSLFPPPTSTVSGLPSPSPSPRPSATPPPSAPTASPTASATPPPTETATSTVTVQPTPIFAKVNSPEGGGAFVRKSPGGEYLLTLSNGFIVEVLNGVEVVNGVTWVQIAVERNGVRYEGWIIQSLLAMPTPIPNWEPTATPTL